MYEKECDTCKYEHLRNSEHPCYRCSDDTFDEWQPKEGKMGKKCNTCRFSYKNSKDGVNCTDYDCDEDFSGWKPIGIPMEERLEAIVERVRVIFPDAGYIQLYPALHDYSHIEGVSVDYSLYVSDLILHQPFPTIEALESHVTELEEKHRKENMTDEEKIREHIAVDRGGIVFIKATDLIEYIDSLPKPEKPMVF